MSADQPPDQNEKVEGINKPMEASGNMTPNGFDEFLQTGRTGRRNAVPDILTEKGAATGDLPAEMEKLSCSDGSMPGTSGAEGGNATMAETTTSAEA